MYVCIYIYVYISIYIYIYIYIYTTKGNLKPGPDTPASAPQSRPATMYGKICQGFSALPLEWAPTRGLSESLTPTVSSQKFSVDNYRGIRLSG